ncbi:VOC family protein [Candidatus Poriferisodalis sp.]|uniref:VOC family protein n=1 Tax=Candidatus Poriferisodalis sp. TaxID=3101277 RepID=UPI003B01CE5D
MLTNGMDHVAVITRDSDQLQRFYIDIFGATIEFDGEEYPGGPRMTVINVGPSTELNVFEIDGNDEASRQTPMFGRGRLDHIGLRAASLDEFREIRSRLMSAGAADDVVTDFGRKLSLFFRDTDRMECEVLVPNPEPGKVSIGSRSHLFPAED